MSSEVLATALSYFLAHPSHYSNGLVIVCADLKRPQELQIGWKDATASSKRTLLSILPHCTESCGGGYTCDRATYQWTSGRHLPRME